MTAYWIPAYLGLELSPATMFEHGIARAGYIEVPNDPDLAYEFLDVEWRTIQHYGVDFDNRRYNGAGLNPYRNISSPYTGKAKGRWPIHHNPDDITHVYFRDPENRKWHTLNWEHAAGLTMPMSADGLHFGRKLAASKYRYPDDRLAVADLLERWNLGLGKTLAERRIALRLARDAAALVGRDEAEIAVTSLPSVARVLASTIPTQSSDAGEDDQEIVPEIGDDDDADFDVDNDAEWGNFYAEALEDV